MTPHHEHHFSGHQFLHAPGPSHVPDKVMDAMRNQPMDLADPRLEALIQSSERGLKRLLQTERSDVFIYAANGHGAWEAVIANLVAPGDQVLIPGTGHFSNGWAEQTQAMGGKVLRTPWEEGFPADVAAIEAALRADRAHGIVAVFAVHTDTASGITSDIAAVRAAIDRVGHPALLVVDVVASLGAAPFAMDALGANVVLGASQKALMVPPGLGFVAVDAKAKAKAAGNTAPRFYWDWGRRDTPVGYQKFCGTAPQNLLMGLDAAFGLIFQEGLPQVMARHRRIAAAVHAAVDGWSEGGALRLAARDRQALSVSVTTVAVNAGIDVEALRTVARERFQVAIAGGLGQLKGRSFRIGHLGDINYPMILGCLSGLEAAMLVQGIPIGGGVRRAIEELARDA